MTRELPGVAEQVLRDDRELFGLTERNDFSVDMIMLTAKIEEGVNKHPCE